MATQENLTVHQNESVPIQVTLEAAGVGIVSKNVSMSIFTPTTTHEITTTTNASGVATFNLTTTHTATAGTFRYEIWNTDDDDKHTYGDITIEAVATGTITLTVGTNTYISLADADTYFSERLNADAWEDSDTKDRSKSLTHATKIIDRLNYLGDKYDEDQALQFPRGTDTTIPTDIEYATCEIAIALLDGIDPDLEMENLGMISQGYGNVRSTYDPKRTPEHILAGVPTASAWRFLKPWVRDFQTVRLNRVS